MYCFIQNTLYTIVIHNINIKKIFTLNICKKKYEKWKDKNDIIVPNSVKFILRIKQLKHILNFVYEIILIVLKRKKAFKTLIKSIYCTYIFLTLLLFRMEFEKYFNRPYVMIITGILEATISRKHMAPLYFFFFFV